MSLFCLPKDLATKLSVEIKSGRLTPQKLIDLKSEGRREYFSAVVGKQNAKELNAAFEAKLLLKNQQKGILNWAQRSLGMKPETKRDLITRVEKMNKILEPNEIDGFLSDLAAKKLGTEVTAEEAATIAKLSRIVTETRAAKDAGGDRILYGAAMVKFYKYTNDLKTKAEERTMREWATDPLAAIVRLGGIAKSLKGSFDDSAIFRQLWKVMMDSPVIWAKHSAKTYLNIARTLKRRSIEGAKKGAKLFGVDISTKEQVTVADAQNAEIMSRETYDYMVKAKLAVGLKEEAFPSEIGNKIPVFGALFEASQDAFTACIQGARADLFDKYLEIARKSGVNIEDRFELESIGKLVNSLTGRGHWGKAEGALEALNNVFFSPRLIKSHLDTILMPLSSTKNISSFARRRARLALGKMIMGGAAILKLAESIGSQFGLTEIVEWDPRSSNFGKIRINDTRFDVFGGHGSLLTLIARAVTNSTKSSNSVKEVAKPIYSGGWQSKEVTDVIYNFFENKTSPLGSTIKSIIERHDFEGEKLTFGGVAVNLFVPLPPLNILKTMKAENAAPVLLVALLDFHGIGSSTYGKPLTDGQKLHRELNKLRDSGKGTEAADIYEKTKTENPALFKMLKAEIEKEKLGITPQDEYVQSLGVGDMERAIYIWEEMKDYSGEDRKGYVEELKRKGVVSDEVDEQLKRIAKAGNPDDIIDEAKEALESGDEEGFVNKISLYAKAWNVDAERAFEIMTSNEKFETIRGDTLITKRAITEAESEKIKQERGYGSMLKDTKLDHTIPKKLGGDDSDENLKVISTEQWEKNTKVEKHLIALLKANKYSGETLREVMLKYKDGEMTAEEIYYKYPKDKK